MPMATTREGDPAPCLLAGEGDMTIYTAGEWRERLEFALASGRDIELDLSGILEIDAAGLQLLIMAKKEAENRGKALRLTNHSPAVLEALDLCGLGSFFGDPLLISSREAQP